MKKEMRDRVDSRVEGIGDVDLVADFADDGVDGGDYECVLKALKGEMAIGWAFGVKNIFSKMKVYLMAGQKFLGDLSGFEEMGIEVDWSGNVLFMQVPIVGSQAFMEEWATDKMKDIKKVLEGLRGLSSKHVALYLLKGAGNACRVLYYVRCCPIDMVGYFINQFDAEFRQTFEDIVGFRVSESQWDQAALGVKLGGMGMTRGNDVADAAYLASRAATHEDCIKMDAHHVWDNGQDRGGDDVEVLGEWVHNAAHRYDSKVPECSKVSGAAYTGIDKQRVLVGKLEKLRGDALKQNAGVWDQARLEGVVAPHAGAWLDAPPSRVQDTRMTNPEIRSRVGRRLGVALCEEMACPFCFCTMDKWGAHAACCMSGGDKTATHHCIRNSLYIHASGREQFRFWRRLMF
jgi:hypothetical protein